MRAGDAFSYTDGSDIRLWVVISDPEADATAFVVCVSLTTYAPHKDDSCLLGPEDYPELIVHPTCVFYADARAMSLSVLRRRLGEGTIVRRTPVCAEVLARIRHGAGTSRHMPLGLRQVLVAQGLTV
jgi:hypothetical protein